ncbi:MAG: transcription antitermination factor NusB [Gammaproteobacteria bacterium]|nr:transcription antitermination factor NusB [Gammaproteobacteria bacterium]
MTPSARRKARRFALQGLYSWQIAGTRIVDIEIQFAEDNDLAKVDTEYFHELMHGVPQHLEEIDGLLKPVLEKRSIDEVDPIERALLRLAAYELLKRPDVPYKVVINEALELAKTFGAEEGFKYVNGVLDKVARVARPVEAARR